MLVNPVVKLELELISLELVVIVEFSLFIKCVFEKLLLTFVIIKLVFEEMLLKCFADVAFNLFITCVFNEIFLKFVFEVSVR